MTDTRQRSRATAGFTLIEMVGALLLLLAFGAVGLATVSRPSPKGEAKAAALRMRAMLQAALAVSELEGGDVVVRAVSDTAATGGRFLALAGPIGVMPEDDPAADWVVLDGGIRWRRGTAASDPMGVPTDGRIPGTVRCSAAACETGSADYVVYYVGHTRSVRASWALLLTRDRELLLYEWDPAQASWGAAAR